jgi:hypothetical protein
MNNNKMLMLGVDAAVLAGLLGMLVAVIGLDALLTHLYPPENTTGPGVTTTTSKAVRLAVTDPFSENVKTNNGIMRMKWDDVGVLLNSMGKDYRYDTIHEQDLNFLDTLKKYDVVFCSCSGMQPNAETAKTLNAYVAQGGTLYASDWRYELVAMAFPEFISRDDRMEGLDGRYQVDVVDAGLRDVLGNPKMELTFELNRWKPAAFGGDRVKVLLRGQYRGMDNQMHTAPLLVKFSFGKGNVIFTSYHHGKNNSRDEIKLLKFLVHKLVTARVETEVEETLHKNQFSQAGSNMFSAPKENASINYSHHNPHAGKLRFDVIFGGGAEMKLVVTSPSGQKKEKQGTSSFFIEVPNAETGNWTYTLTALRLPTDDFNVDTRVSHSKK